MSRLTDLAGKLPQAGCASGSGVGFRAWKTRRANSFVRDVAVLIDARSPLPVLQLAAHAAGEYIALPLGGCLTALPRGYAVVLNSDGDPGLARGEKLLNPGLTEPLPDMVTIEAFGRDLRTGFLAEIDELLKAVKL